MKPLTRNLDLTDEEIVHLDGGPLQPKTLQAVASARRRIESRKAHPHLTPARAGLIADIIEEAESAGRLDFRRVGVESCHICKRKAGYAPHKRTTHNATKGEPNHKKPRTIAAADFAIRGLIINRYVRLGACMECVEAIRDDLVSALVGVPAQVPEALTGHRPRFGYHKNHQCGLCGWTGHDGLMGRERTIVFDGYYPAVCPSCGKRDCTKIIDGFVVVDTTTTEAKA